MASEKETIAQGNQEVKKCCRNKNKGGAQGAFYGLGLIGAAVYFIQHAQSFTDGLLGILKAIVWPALVAYKFFEFFKF
jgi:hypothetical protein